jgi:hypothetical protein
MPNPTSIPTCRSGQPGSLWWIESGVSVLYTQWDALVRNFQTRALQLLPRQYDPTAYYASTFTVDGIYGTKTAAALGACLALAGYSDEMNVLGTETARSVISQTTIAQLVFFALHVTSLATPDRQLGATTSPTPFGPKSPFIQIQGNTVLPAWDQPVLSLPLDRSWVGLAPVGSPRPSSPSEMAAMNNGAVAPRNTAISPTGSTANGGTVIAPPVIAPTVPPASAQAQGADTPMSTTTKVLVALGVVAAGAGGYYYFHRGRK